MTTVRRLGVVLSVALPLTLGPGIASASAASGGGCTSNPASAINQYCETIPGATGAKPPGAGSPALRSTLPPRVLRKINGPQGSVPAAARRQLLALPAPVGAQQQAAGRNGKRAGIVAGVSGAVGGAGVTGRASIAGGASVWPLALTLILILVAIALALAAAALLRWRHLRRAA